MEMRISATRPLESPTRFTCPYGALEKKNLVKPIENHGFRLTKNITTGVRRKPKEIIGESTFSPMARKNIRVLLARPNHGNHSRILRKPWENQYILANPVRNQRPRVANQT